MLPLLLRGAAIACLLSLCMAANSTSNPTPRPVIPETPKMKTLGGQLVFSVGANRRVAIQYGDNEGETVFLDDPSESTIEAIKLGYA